MPVDALRVFAEVGNAAKALAVFSLSIVFAYLVRIAIERRVMKTLPRQIAVPLVKSIYYTIIFLGGVGALAAAGVNLSGLLVAGGIAGIILGFASQAVISNLLSGMFLYIDRPFTVGDPIILGDIEGIVENITVFSTRVRRWDGVIARIPNETVFRSTILNPYQNPVRRFEHLIVISHDSSVEEASRIALEVMEDDVLVLARPGPEVLVLEVRESGVLLSIRGWAPSQYWFSTKNRVLRRIKERFDEAGIRTGLPPRLVVFEDGHPGGG